MSDLSRRHLLRGNWQRKRLVVRPPWTVSESEFIDRCARCNDCLNHCQTKVIISGQGGFPELDFSRGECLFCGDCVRVCQESLFNQAGQAPWTHKVNINSGCLAHQHIECRVCKDSCSASAIEFKLEAGAMAQPRLDTLRCNGCGACISSCPVQSIHVIATGPRDR